MTGQEKGKAEDFLLSPKQVVLCALWAFMPGLLAAFIGLYSAMAMNGDLQLEAVCSGTVLGIYYLVSLVLTMTSEEGRKDFLKTMNPPKSLPLYKKIIGFPIMLFLAPFFCYYKIYMNYLERIHQQKQREQKP